MIPNQSIYTIGFAVALLFSITVKGVKNEWMKAMSLLCSNSLLMTDHGWYFCFFIVQIMWVQNFIEKPVPTPIQFSLIDIPAYDLPSGTPVKRKEEKPKHPLPPSIRNRKVRVVQMPATWSEAPEKKQAKNDGPL